MTAAQNDTTFDISTKAVNETAEVELNDADGEPLLNPTTGKQCMIVVYGPGSTQYQRAQGRRNRAVIETVRKGAKKMKDNDQRELDAAFLADCTKELVNFTYGTHASPQDMFKAMYLDPKIGFISNQVNSVLGDWSAFTKPSAKI